MKLDLEDSLASGQLLGLQQDPGTLFWSSIMTVTPLHFVGLLWSVTVNWHPHLYSHLFSVIDI